MSAPAMMTAAENDLLCRVEGDAPMGKLMRQHWVPALLGEEVAEPDGAPVRVRVLGENLVAFRDTEGRVGVLDELCPHRRASLVYGRNEKCGLRCLYHGWKMDVDGNVVEMASEPAASALKEKVRARAFPVREAGGFVWVFLGNPGAVPEFQRPSFAPDEDTRVSILKMVVPANWAQIVEGQIDSSHSSSLHSTDMVPARVDSAGANDTRWLRPSTDKAPRMQSQRTPYGFRYVALRRPIKSSSTHVYARVTVYVAPFVALIPPNTSYNVASVIVPMGDEQSAFYFIAWGGEDCVDTAAWRRFNHTVVGETLDAGYRSVNSRENRFGQNRDAMREGSYTGITGIPNQDYAMWVSMGPIVDRTRERLGASDLAIVEFRRLMVEAARRVQAGEPAIGTAGPRVRHASIASYQGVVPKTTDWRTLGVGDEERAVSAPAAPDPDARLNAASD